MKKKLTLDYLNKVKELKQWSHMHAPALIEPVLSYALDWLSPELLGTGFKITSIADNKVTAMLPYSKANCDFQQQIHLGVVVNAAQEVASALITRHWPKDSWSISEAKVELSKKIKWNSDLLLTLETSDFDLDRLLVDLQKNHKAEFQAEVTIQPKKQSKKDSIHLDFLLVKTNLIS